MARLTPAQMDRRLRMDEGQAAAINLDPAPIDVTAHMSAADARSGINPVGPGNSASPPEHYRVTYDFDTLVAADVRSRPTIVHVDLLANGNYPFSEPVCRTVGNKVPFTPHFDRKWPICIGKGWTSDGRRLIDDLIVHVAKLLNFDEPPPTPGYHGYNAAAIAWWARQEFRPLNPDLRYPLVDLNGVEGGGFRPRFRPLGQPTHAPPRLRMSAAPVRFRPGGGWS
jgi:hypothetical protein